MRISIRGAALAAFGLLAGCVAAPGTMGDLKTARETCNRDYGSVNYKDFCGYFYVPAGGIRTGPAPP